MRKRYKDKKGSCQLCHPEKTGHAPRFTPQELASRKETEKVIHSLQGKAPGDIFVSHGRETHPLGADCASCEETKAEFDRHMSSSEHLYGP